MKYVIGIFSKLCIWDGCLHISYESMSITSFIPTKFMWTYPHSSKKKNQSIYSAKIQHIKYTINFIIKIIYAYYLKLTLSLYIDIDNQGDF